MKIMCDTNVIIDVLLEREPFVENSCSVLSLCERHKISPINKFDLKTPTMGDVEQNISSIDVKEDDDNGTWLDDLWSGIQDLGNILFGMGKNDEEGEDGISNSAASKVGEVSDIDVVNSYFEIINDDYKPLKERLEAVKKIYQAASAQDKDMAAQQTIILFESDTADFLVLARVVCDI